MKIADVITARSNAHDRPCWPAVFLKAYAGVAEAIPALRRAYFGLPWPHLREYPKSIANIAIQRVYCDEPCVFFGRIADPWQLSLSEIHSHIREFAETPVESVRFFRRMLLIARLPRPVRRSLLWLGLNLPRSRPVQFGTFGMSVYSSLGAESLHPLSPLTTTFNYGVIEPDGTVWVRLIYDHRVFDGATAARALSVLEDVLNEKILNELRDMGQERRAA
jgi:hypothetical protein